jgi:DNA-binding MarR family transcriptional regulator
MKTGQNNHSESGSPIVDVVAKMNITGHIIAPSWYDTILCDAHGRKSPAKPDRVTIDILSEIVFWYKPSFKRQGKHLKTQKRFKADLLQLDRGTLASKFKVSKRQVSRSLEKLEQLGVINRVLRTVNKGDGGGKLRNVLYIELIPEGLARVSRVELPSESSPDDMRVNTSGPFGPHNVTSTSPRADVEVQTNTETTTSKTTPSHSSGAERPYPGGEISNKSNSGYAVLGAAAPNPAAVVELPPADSGLSPRTLKTAISNINAELVLEFTRMGYEHFLAEEYENLPNLGDRLDRIKDEIEEFFLKNNRIRPAAVIETILSSWYYELESKNWYAKKLRSAPELFCRHLGNGDKQKEVTTLEGAALELGVSLLQTTQHTQKIFEAAGIMDAFKLKIKSIREKRKTERNISATQEGMSEDL